MLTNIITILWKFGIARCFDCEKWYWKKNHTESKFVSTEFWFRCNTCLDNFLQQETAEDPHPDIDEEYYDYQVTEDNWVHDYL